MDNESTINDWTIKIATGTFALLVATWAWFVRVVVMKRLNQMEARVNELETRGSPGLREIQAEMKGVSQRIDAHLSTTNTQLNEAQKIIFGKI